MKVLQFTIPVVYEKSVITDQVELPYHYPYLHRHKEAQITWVQQGEGTLVAGSNMHDFKAGDIFLIGANLPHLFKSNPEYFSSESRMSVKAFTLFFNPDGILAALLNLPEMKQIKSFLQQHQKGFKIPEQDVQGIATIMKAVRDTYGADQVTQFLSLLQGLLQINHKLEPLSSYSEIPSITEFDGIRIGHIYNFIMQNYSTAVTLEDAARAAFMTPESFCRYFKKHTGNTFISFLNNFRVNEACKKLTANKYDSISTIAFKCGFNSITNFNRVFKHVTGKTPREYLDNYHNNVVNRNQLAN